MSAQIVLLRQSITVFYGNEISVGFLLFAWLFWGALGSWLLGRLADKIKQRLLLFALLEIILGLILVAAIFLMRNASKSGTMLTEGEVFWPHLKPEDIWEEHFLLLRPKREYT